MPFKFKVSPSMEKYNGRTSRFEDGYKEAEIRIPLTHTIFGKECKFTVDVYAIGEDGHIDQKVIDAYNKFFVDLPKLIESKKSLILEAVNLDNEEKDRPITWEDVKKNFLRVQDCLVEKQGSDIIAHASLEWKYNPKGDNDFRFDSEHGNGFAMVNGKFEMGKPGDFY